MPTIYRGRPLRRVRTWLARTTIAASLLVTCAAVAETHGSALTLSEALARAQAFDPVRPVLDAWVKAGEAAVRQAGVRLNPSLDIELENFAGTGVYALADRTEATVSYQQTLERGGKQSARTGLARAQVEVTRLRGAVRALDMLREVQVAYVEALAAEADLVVVEARLVAVMGAQSDVERRVKSARDPLFAASRAETVTAQAVIARDEARTAAADARSRLAGFWNGGANYVLDVKTFFEAVPPTAAPATLIVDLQMLAAERDAAIAAVRVEQAKAIADPTVRGGVRYLGQGGDVALVIGGTIPLQRYDTNAGGVARAQAERMAAEAEIEAARLARERELAHLTRRMTAASREAERIRTEVIPVAIQAVEQVREGFNRGGFQYIDIAEAEKALFDVRVRRVAVLRQFHLDQAALDRLTGRHAAPVTRTTSAEPRR